MNSKAYSILILYDDDNTFVCYLSLKCCTVFGMLLLVNKICADMMLLCIKSLNVYSRSKFISLNGHYGPLEHQNYLKLLIGCRFIKFF